MDWGKANVPINHNNEDVHIITMDENLKNPPKTKYQQQCIEKVSNQAALYLLP